MVTTAAPPATTHQRARPVVQACHPAASATELASGIRFGFQMNVDSSTALVETVIRRPAIRPATGPPIERPSHHVTATASMPASAIVAVTAIGSAPDSAADRKS